MFGVNFLFALMLSNPNQRSVEPLCSQDCASYVMQVRSPNHEQPTKRGPVLGPVWSRGMLVGTVGDRPLFLTPGPTRLGTAYGFGLDTDW